MNNIASKLLDDYELEVTKLVIVSNKLGLILEGGVPDNDVSKFMEDLSMGDEKKKKLSDALEVIKQEGGNRFLEDMGDAMNKSKYDVIRKSKEE